MLALCLLLSTAAHVAVLLLLTLLWHPMPTPPAPERVTEIDLRPLAPKPEPPPPDDTLARRDPDEKQERERKPEPPKPKPKRKRPEREKPEPEVELDPIPEPEPEPEPEKQPEPEPEPPQEKQPIEIVLEQLKMVEQPDALDDDKAPEDANYLSNVNRDVREEMQARVTNLERDAEKQNAKQLERSDSTEQGTANEHVIAEDEKVESQLNRKAPASKPDVVEQRIAEDTPKQETLLSMRASQHRDHALPQDAHEALANEAENGQLQATREFRAAQDARDQQARVDKQDARNRFKLNLKDYEAVFGKDLSGPAREESQRQSKTKGVWADARAHFQSPLENMVPEVQVGNQTALRSRKHPFARYIAQMHRKIHPAYAWNYLEQLETYSRNHPLSNYDLWTRVEIVLDADGNVEKVMTVRHSGVMAFDAAAREIVYAQGPYPNPPREILSGNGKVYLHWAFHRNANACGTFGVSPFILDNAGQGDRPDPNVVVRPGRGGGEMLDRRLDRKPTAPNVPEGPVPPTTGVMPHAHDHDHDHQHEGEGEAAIATGTIASPDAAELAADPKAKRVADEWLYYFNKGDVAKLVLRSSLPFYSGDTVIARTRQELGDLLSTLTAEAGSKSKGSRVYTASQLRKVFGSVPAGVQEGEPRVYVLTKFGDDFVVLLLERKFGAWRVVGTTR